MIWKQQANAGGGAFAGPSVCLQVLLACFMAVGAWAEPADDSDPRGTHIELFPARNWVVRPHWVPEGSADQSAALVWDDDGPTQFMVPTPGCRAVWACSLYRPVPVDGFPGLEVALSSREADVDAPSYAVAVLTQRGSRTVIIPVIGHDALPSNHGPETLHVDLARVAAGEEVIGLAVQVVASPYARGIASVGLQAVRFVAGEEHPGRVQQAEWDATFTVVDGFGLPVPDALVIADAERLNEAAWARTGSEGDAELTVAGPHAGGAGMVRVEKEDYAVVETTISPRSAASAPLVLPILRQCSGAVRTAGGAPVARALVSLSIPVISSYGQVSLFHDACLTGEDGRWTLQLPLAPSSDQSVVVRVCHPEEGRAEALLAADDLLARALDLRSSAEDREPRNQPVRGLIESGDIGLLSRLASDSLESEGFRWKAGLALIEALRVLPQVEDDALRALLNAAAMDEGTEMARLFLVGLKSAGGNPGNALAAARELIPGGGRLPNGLRAALTDAESDWRAAFDGLRWADPGSAGAESVEALSMVWAVGLPHGVDLDQMVPRARIPKGATGVSVQSESTALPSAFFIPDSLAPDLVTLSLGLAAVVPAMRPASCARAVRIPWPSTGRQHWSQEGSARVSVEPMPAPAGPEGGTPLPLRLVVPGGVPPPIHFGSADVLPRGPGPCTIPPLASAPLPDPVDAGGPPTERLTPLDRATPSRARDGH